VLLIARTYRTSGPQGEELRASQDSPEKLRRRAGLASSFFTWASVEPGDASSSGRGGGVALRLFHCSLLNGFAAGRVRLRQPLFRRHGDETQTTAVLRIEAERTDALAVFAFAHRIYFPFLPSLTEYLVGVLASLSFCVPRLID